MTGACTLVTIREPERRYHAVANDDSLSMAPLPPMDGDTESSSTLLARSKAGDADAVDRLCARYLPRLRAWAHGRLPRWARGVVDTQDLAQDTLAQVLRNIHRFEPRHEGAFQVYVREALANRIRDEVRRAQRRRPPEPLSDRPSMGPSPLEEALGRETLERYERALASLRPEDREVIVLRVEMGYSYPSLVEALGKPGVAAAYMAVSRALVRLAKEMAHGA